MRKGHQRPRDPESMRLIFHLNYKRIEKEGKGGYEWDGTGYFSDGRKGTVVLDEYNYSSGRKDELIAIVFCLLCNLPGENLMTLKFRYKWMMEPVAFLMLVYNSPRYLNLFKNSVIIRTLLLVEKNLSVAYHLNMATEGVKLANLLTKIYDMFKGAYSGGPKKIYDPAKYSWTSLAQKQEKQKAIEAQKEGKVDEAKEHLRKSTAGLF